MQKPWNFTQVFYGGVIEEVVFRFGFMSFFTWLFNLWFSNILWSIWIANILAALLFALAHLPSVQQLKVTDTKLIYLYMNSTNAILGLVCGWLYWKEGLAAAIICHMTFHIVWFIAEKIEPHVQKHDDLLV
ncbi:CPBP family glutamic-type intramembrane protease [Mesobacillus subterraneus]|uniref:CPBP family glutamic-type intramembrane protease n=1 Tax=Mesobacillus subterraneus TaxID=285983 RepID=UPI001CFD6F5F|nr:CPBP family glutamic-type intramembrane protease [Mesobacillus subterraneus]WLR57751.1 CPBP family glutamic-type intramembrane protease [Mesobacillus subterraneus]